MNKFNVKPANRLSISPFYSWRKCSTTKYWMHVKIFLLVIFSVILFNHRFLEENHISKLRICWNILSLLTGLNLCRWSCPLLWLSMWSRGMASIQYHSVQYTPHDLWTLINSILHIQRFNADPALLLSRQSNSTVAKGK